MSAFSSAFIVCETLPELWRRMPERVQDVDEDVLKYVGEKERMCKRLKLGVKDTALEIIRCLRLHKISFAHRDREYESIDQLLQAIKPYDAFSASR